MLLLRPPMPTCVSFFFFLKTQHAFLILTTSKGKDRKEHDLLRHEAEFITFVSQVATAACEELVPYDGGGKENSSTPFTSSILVCIQSFFSKTDCRPLIGYMNYNWHFKIC